MIYLNNFIHPDKNIQGKINFFADYFYYSASQSADNDFHDIENYLSLFDKIIFQIETNIEKCIHYINRYLEHPLLKNSDDKMNKFGDYSTVIKFLIQYNRIRLGERVSWIKENPNFLEALKKYRIELKNNMFNQCVDELLSYIKCPHSINDHQKDIIHYTNILVSSFLLNGYTKEDLKYIFLKVFSKDIRMFPFTESFNERHKENLNENKMLFLENITLDQQFDALKDIFHEPSNYEFLIFRIFNIRFKNKTKFQYNKVTFYHPEHQDLKGLNFQIRSRKECEDFMTKKEMVIAKVQVEYKSHKVAEKTAIKTINEELVYLNNRCNSFGVLDGFYHFSTFDFQVFFPLWKIGANNYTIDDAKIDNLNNNSYSSLNDYDTVCSRFFLSLEYLFQFTEGSNKPEQYWIYFEALFQGEEKNPKEIIECISKILSKDGEGKSNIELYIINSIIHSSAKVLSISQSKMNEFRATNNFDLNEIRKEVNHSFISFLFTKHRNISNTNSLNEKSENIKRILWDCYAQRNSIIHSNKSHDKSLIILELKLKQITNRFRYLLIEGMRNESCTSFSELLMNLQSST
ncbi:MAG: hypothetical protein ACPGSD_10320 [Flavobacteriales bacterium]